MWASCMGPMASGAALGTGTDPTLVRSTADVAAVVAMINSNSGSTRYGSAAVPVGGVLVPAVVGGTCPRPGAAVTTAAFCGCRYLAANCVQVSGSGLDVGLSPKAMVALV